MWGPVTNETSISKGYFLLKYMSEPTIFFYFNLNVLQLLPVFLNMSICTYPWVKGVCTFAISDH